MVRKKILFSWLSVVVATNIYAVEVKIGKGDFSWNVGFQNVLKGSIDISTDIIGISEQHYQLGSSKFYLFGNLDIYSSKELDGFTDIIDMGMSQNIPFLNNTPNQIMGEFVPVPSSYKMRGADFDIGVGYHLLHNSKGFVGIGVATGISMPFMEMENYIEAGEFFLNGLEKTETEIMTYKAGVSLQGSYKFIDNFGVYSTWICGIQSGEIENDLVKSSMDTSGTYTSFDIGVKYIPNFEFLNNLYFTLGHSYKKWDIDEIEVEVMGLKTPNFASIFNIDLESSYSYLSMGYQF